jgi:cold shock CspA family protein
VTGTQKTKQRRQLTGAVRSFDELKGSGTIDGDDGLLYIFDRHAYSFDSVFAIWTSQRVAFEIARNPEKRIACNIQVLPSEKCDRS